MSLVNSFPGGNGGGSGLPSGGTTGQVLAKKSNTDNDAEWVNPVSTDDCFKTSDGYMGEASFYDGDAIPIFTGSTLESRAKKLATWGKIKLALKAYFDTLYSTIKTSKAAAQGGTDLSLVTTGEKYTWNNAGGGASIYANAFNKSDIYSTTEKIVGCWTDGRPLYQKTINVGSIPNNTAKTIAHGISNPSIKKAIGYTHSADWSVGTTIPAVSSDNVAAQIKITWNNTNLIVTTSSDLSGFEETYVTIQYTKTTDAANSFNYADENDYSTTEHVVGKWIDGKPLYQKTIDFGALPNNTAKLVNHGISNLKNIIKYNCIAYSTSAGLRIPIPFTAFDEIDKQIAAYVSDTQIGISDGKDRSDYSAYITLQYTKTTD